MSGMTAREPHSRPGPFSARILAAIAGLTLLFALLAPEASEPLALPARFLFWLLHIAIGLAAALVAARAMVSTAAVPRDWRLILFSGVAGVALFAPVAYLLENLFPGVQQDPDGQWPQGLADVGVLGALLVEALELAPSYLAAWFLVNLEPLTAMFRPAEASDSKDYAGADKNPADPARQVFLERLPAAIGAEVVAVASDLHYLKVYTTRGRAMILGSLQEVEDAFGQDGLRVHRSHWVMLARVARLRQRRSRWFAELEGGLVVPISRRRRADVIGRLGRDGPRDDGAAPLP